MLSDRRRGYVVGVVAMLVFAHLSCGRTPTSPPTPPPSQPGNGPAPAPITVVRLELGGPGEIAPGESVQLTLNAFTSDGSVEDVSDRAAWTSSDAAILPVTATGRATGRNAGESMVTGAYAGRSATRQTLVLPRGTFRLRGVVSANASGIENVAVIILSGVGEGLSALTSIDGSYALYGVAGTVRLHAKKDGFANALQQVDVAEHKTHNFAITAAPAGAPPAGAPGQPGSPMPFDGTYTLTISASPCSSAEGDLPESARRRTYTADLRQDGSRVTVALRGADFIVNNGSGSGFDGTLGAPDLINFRIGSTNHAYYEDPRYDLVERFDGGALIIHGRAAVVGTPERLSGSLDGMIAVSSISSIPFWPYRGRCFASAHGFELVRR